MNLNTEYLIIVDKELSEAFFQMCDSVEAFYKLLNKSDPDIVISGKQIEYQKESKFSISVKTNKVKGKQQRFFYVKITFVGEDTDVDKYVMLLKSIRGIAYRSGGQPETLWDDVSLYYSQKAYLLVNKIENLMRKLITYFMLTNIGKDWLTQTSPDIVIDAIEKSKRKQYIDVLHQIDFIHLGDFLFKPYHIKDPKELFSLISNAKTQDDLKIEELKVFEAKSNWEKYFSKIVECTDEYIDNRWKSLYELRCKVAHNALLNKDEYERINRLVNEIEIPLEKAIDNLDKVQVPQEEKEQVAENVVGSINTLFGEFVQAWKLFETTLKNVEREYGITQEKYHTIIHTLELLREKEVIDDDYCRDSLELMRFRNQVVHESRIDFTENMIRNQLSKKSILLS